VNIAGARRFGLDRGKDLSWKGRTPRRDLASVRRSFDDGVESRLTDLLDDELHLIEAFPLAARRQGGYRDGDGEETLGWLHECGQA
jgi:hypothetical protein